MAKAFRDHQGENKNNALGSTRQALLLTDPERLIGLGRLISALCVIVALYVDPSQPARYREEAGAIMVGYLALALVLFVFPIRKRVDSPIHIIEHLADAIILGGLVLLTDELTSPIFSFLPFVLMAMTVRWGFRGAMLGAAMLELVLLTVGVPDTLDGHSELNLLIIRSAYFLIAAVMLGYFGAYRESSREKLAALAEWPFDSVSPDARTWLDSTLSHAARILGGSRFLVIWRDQEVAQGDVAYWEGALLNVTAVNDERFWSKADPERLFEVGGAKITMSADGEVLEAAMAPLPITPPRPTNFMVAASFSGITYRGVVCIIDPACQPDETLSLARIIATKLGSELERRALVQQAANNVRIEERARLARDLHDGILQDLTATSLKLRVMGNVLGGDAASHLDEISALVMDQQRRLRQFVENQRDVRDSPLILLRDELTKAALNLSQNWECRVGIDVNPRHLNVSVHLADELSQIISEATANAVRHGRANQIHMTADLIDDRLFINIDDNGHGITGKSKQNMPTSLQGRVRDLGGVLSATDLSPGLSLSFNLPLRVVADDK